MWYLKKIKTAYENAKEKFLKKNNLDPAKEGQNWNITKKTKLNTNIGYQFGQIGRSRLDYAGGANPSPTYY